MPAQELLSDADAENRLLEIANNIVKPMLKKIFHRRACRSLSREDNPVGTEQYLDVIGNYRIASYTL